MRQSELNRLREEFRAALEQFYSRLAYARESNNVHERVRRLGQAITAHGQALDWAKVFLAGKASQGEAAILRFDSL